MSNFSGFEGATIVQSRRDLTHLKPHDELRVFHQSLRGDFNRLSVRLACFAERVYQPWGDSVPIENRYGYINIDVIKLLTDWKLIKARYIPGLHSSMSRMERLAFDTILEDFLWVTLQGASSGLRVIYSENVRPGSFHRDLGGSLKILRTYNGDGTRFLPVKSATIDSINPTSCIKVEGGIEYQSSPGDYTCHRVRRGSGEGTFHESPNKASSSIPRLLMFGTV